MDRLFEAQHGLTTHGQALAAGLSRKQVHQRVHSGRWVVVHPEVYRIAGAPRTWHQDLLAACLAAGPGAAVSHRAAVQLWGLDGVTPGLVESRSRGRVGLVCEAWSSTVRRTSPPAASPAGAACR